MSEIAEPILETPEETSSQTSEETSRPVGWTATQTWEARIYVGSRERYDGPEFPATRVAEAIQSYQESAPDEANGCVRLAKASYLLRDYFEGGYEVGIVQYPRFPKSIVDLGRLALQLARHLLLSLNQNRVLVVMPTETLLLEAEDAEQHPKKYEEQAE